MAQTEKRSLTTGPIFSTLFVFSIPTLLSNVLQSLNGSINTVWVGRFLGENALAATASANLIMFLMFSLVFGFGMAATVLVGQAFGRKDIETARRVFGAALLICIVLSLFVTVLGRLFCVDILKILSTPGAAFGQAKAYLGVIFFAIPPTLVLILIMMALRGLGDSLTPLIFMGVNVFFDALLNPLFMLGIGPFPQWGIRGAAFGTVMAAYISLIGIIFYIYYKDIPLRLRGPQWLYILPKPALLGKILFMGFAMCLQMLVMASASLVMVSFVNKEGVNIAAAYNVTQQLWTYLQMPAMAVGAAVSAMAAQNVGAGLWKRVTRITTVGVVLVLLLTTIMLVLFFFFNRPMMHLFVGQQEHLIQIANHIQLLASWSFLFFGISMVISATFRANRAVLMPLLFLFISLYPVRLGFYHFFYPRIGADAIWLSFPIGAIAAVIMSVLYYISGLWCKQTKALPAQETQQVTKIIDETK